MCRWVVTTQPIMSEVALYPMNFDARGAPLLRGFRGTIVLSGRRVLRTRGLTADYERLLSAPARAALDAVTAGDLVPMALAEAHEDALDRLGLARDDQRSFGAEMSEIVNGVVYSTLIRLVGATGASPFVVFKQANKTWSRLYDGGAVAAYQLAPSIARVEVWGDSLARHEMHREAFGGALLHAVASFCKTPALSELPTKRSENSFAFQVKW
jgi:hypothetical protein